MAISCHLFVKVKRDSSSMREHLKNCLGNTLVSLMMAEQNEKNLFCLASLIPAKYIRVFR